MGRYFIIIYRYKAVAYNKVSSVDTMNIYADSCATQKRVLFRSQCGSKILMKIGKFILQSKNGFLVYSI